MSWQCQTCGKQHADTPLCFGIDPPWPDYVPEAEFADRVDHSRDLCVVDKKIFFVRGHLEVPIHGQPEPFVFAVWSSLSEQSFSHMSARWKARDRASDPPYFGWLSSSLWIYPETINLKLSVQSRQPGLVPLFTVEPSEHPLALDQHNGITIARWNDLAHQLLHASVGEA